MKSPGTAWSLLRFNLRLLPWTFWFLVLLLFLIDTKLNVSMNTWTSMGHSVTSLEWFHLLFCALLAGRLFGSAKGYPAGLIAQAEFLLTRPVTRRTAYFSRVFLLFSVILLPSLAGIWAASARPELRVALCESQDDFPADARLQLYQFEFPQGSVRHDDPRFMPRGYRTTFVVPSGNLCVASWNLLTSVLATLLIQALSFSPSARRELGWSLFGNLFVIYILFVIAFDLYFLGTPQKWLISPYESGFFYFVSHPIHVWLFSLAVFVGAQWLAFRFIRYVEVTN